MISKKNEIDKIYQVKFRYGISKGRQNNTEKD